MVQNLQRPRTEYSILEAGHVDLWSKYPWKATRSDVLPRRYAELPSQDSGDGAERTFRAEHRLLT